MITLTDRAQARILEYGGKAHLSVRPLGCNGWTYQLKLRGEGTTIFSGSVTITTDVDDPRLIDGVHIDFKQDGLNEAFAFSNPNAKSTCGCGTSFSLG
jgi:iron-sulfur cluster assembly protein